MIKLISLKSARRPKCIISYVRIVARVQRRRPIKRHGGLVDRQCPLRVRTHLEPIALFVRRVTIRLQLAALKTSCAMCSESCHTCSRCVHTHRRQDARNLP